MINRRTLSDTRFFLVSYFESVPHNLVEITNLERILGKQSVVVELTDVGEHN